MSECSLSWMHIKLQSLLLKVTLNVDPLAFFPQTLQIIHSTLISLNLLFTQHWVHHYVQLSKVVWFPHITIVNQILLFIPFVRCVLFWITFPIFPSEKIQGPLEKKYSFVVELVSCEILLCSHLCNLSVVWLSMCLANLLAFIKDLVQRAHCLSFTISIELTVWL